MSTVARIRSCAEGLLQGYRDREGQSSDPYCAEPRFHPMAEGKYLLALAALKRADCIGQIRHEQWLAAGISRLGLHAIRGFGQGVGFGLNFSYKQAPANEPYLITSAIVLHGLLENLTLVEDKNRFAELAKTSVQWLQEVPRISAPDREDFKLPVFSPHNSFIVYNAVAYWAGALHQASNMDLLSGYLPCQAFADWLWEKFVPGQGWPYGPESSRFDLLHQCYILNSLLVLGQAIDMEWQTMQALSQFFVPGYLIDKFDLLAPEEAVAIAANSKGVCARIHPGQAQILHNEPARVWSRGEMLTVMAAMAMHGSCRDYWYQNLVRNAKWCVDSWQREEVKGSAEGWGFRHSMHLAHGLARALEVMRKQRQ